MPGDGVANLARSAIGVRSAVGAGFAFTGGGVADFALSAGDPAVDAVWCWNASHGIVADLTRGAIRLLRFGRAIPQRNALPLAVATAAAFAPTSARAIGIARTGFWRLFDALVGESVAQIGLAVVAWASRAVAAVLALAGRVLTYAVFANQPLTAIAF